MAKKKIAHKAPAKAAKTREPVTRKSLLKVLSTASWTLPAPCGAMDDEADTVTAFANTALTLALMELGGLRERGRLHAAVVAAALDRMNLRADPDEQVERIRRLESQIETARELLEVVPDKLLLDASCNAEADEDDSSLAALYRVARKVRTAVDVLEPEVTQ